MRQAAPAKMARTSRAPFPSRAFQQSRLIAQHSIEDGGSMDQVSSLRFSGSQTIFDGYAGDEERPSFKRRRPLSDSPDRLRRSHEKSRLSVRQAYYTILGDQDTVLLRQATEKQAAENLALYQGCSPRNGPRSWMSWKSR